MYAADTLRACLTDEVMRNASVSICEAAPKTRRAVGAAVAMLLAALAELSSRAEGARALARGIVEEGSLALDSLPDQLRGSQANMLMERGAGALVDLLGGDFMEEAGKAINRYAGIGVGAAKSLASLLMPVVLTAVRQSVAPRVEDEWGVAEVMEAQRSSIAGAFPSDFNLIAESDPRLCRCAAYLREAEDRGVGSGPLSAEPTMGRLRAMFARLIP